MGERSEAGAAERDKLGRVLLEAGIGASAYDGRGNCGQEGSSDAAEWVVVECGVAGEFDMGDRALDEARLTFCAGRSRIERESSFELAEERTRATEFLLCASFDSSL